MRTKKKILVLGSTGSIGRQALSLAAAMPDRLEIFGLAAHSNVGLLLEQARVFHPQAIGLVNEEAGTELRERARSELDPLDCAIYQGAEGIEELAATTEADLALCCMLGTGGLRPTLAALRSGKDIALANKETLVAAGELVTREARSYGVRLLPVDSEHSALFQCLQGELPEAVKRVILTASGGPFLHTSPEDLCRVTVEQALSHPTWRMGNKISVDSATLMNKGLEIIEAHHLFGVGVDRIEVLVHPQSIIHSMVEFVDGSVKAQMGVPDMRLPILYALFYPERVENSEVPGLDLRQTSRLTFQEPDVNRFPCLRLAREALKLGGTMPAVMNAANEAAVGRFIEGNSGFMDIPNTIKQVMKLHDPIFDPSMAQILEADAWARRQAATCGKSGVTHV
ncbi:MAG: 1-deoxy-D-xylulose-5-phosphate reductoisomerase [Armatimonadetes bacterium]|nr:1-deoxy-D-xylulose-5-phosphate reductoisomerase [Armatimonadota bacterium]